MLPRHSWEFEALEQTLLDSAPVPLMTIMLGTNDVLMDSTLPLTRLTGAMENLLDRLESRFLETTILLIAPPAVRVGVRELEEKMGELSACYARLARKRHLCFCDAWAWKLPLAHDGVHLSEEGHRIFAENLLAFIAREKSHCKGKRRMQLHPPF